MIRNLKGLGLAFLAIFAMSAIAASAAQAEAGKGPSAFTAEQYPATLDGEQTGAATVFAREGRTVTCEKATYGATITGKATTVTVHPAYSNCHSIILGTKFDATVTFADGCDYLFHTTTDVVNGVDTFTAISDLVCAAGNDVQIDIYKAGTPTTALAHADTNNFLCAFTFKGAPENQGLKTIDLTNKAAGGITPKDWIEADINISGVSSKRVDGTALSCGAENNATGTLVGNASLKGTNGAGEANGLTVTTE
jgi:hypothetical protein